MLAPITVTPTNTCPSGVPSPCFLLHATLSPYVEISYDGDSGTELVGNPYPRYPMQITVDLQRPNFVALTFVDGNGDVAAQFTGSDMVREKTITRGGGFNNGYDDAFFMGSPRASAQGGTELGLLLRQYVDDSSYPYDPGSPPLGDTSQFGALKATKAYISLDSAWWNTYRVTNQNTYFNVDVPLTVVDGVGAVGAATQTYRLYAPTIPPFDMCIRWDSVSTPGGSTVSFDGDFDPAYWAPSFPFPPYETGSFSFDWGDGSPVTTVPVSGATHSWGDVIATHNYGGPFLGASYTVTLNWSWTGEGIPVSPVVFTVQFSVAPFLHLVGDNASPLCVPI